MSEKSKTPSVPADAGESTPARRPLDICEEGMHLLRKAPLDFHVHYALGVIPFFLTFLLFWSDMSQSAFASRHLLSASVAMAGAFVWMKVWQAIACYRLRCLLYATTPSPWKFSGLLRLVIRQITWQPTGFVILPLGLLITLPFAACYAFYQNLTVMESPESDEADAPLLQRALQRAQPWPQQGFKLIGIFLWLGLIVTLNIFTLFIFLPSLAKSLLGLDTAFSRNSWLILNSTVLLCTFLGAYLIIDLLAKACYLVRCYDWESLGTGQDLRTQWARLQRQRRTGARSLIAGLIISVSLALQAPPAHGQSQAPLTSNQEAPVLLAATDAELDEAIDHVLTDRRYVWRQPRDHSDSVEGIELPGWMATIRDWIERFLEWLLGKENSSEIPGGGSTGWVQGLTRVALYLIIAILAGALLYQFLKRRKPKENLLIEAQKKETAEPDLSDEDIAADDLPSSEWSRLGARLLAEGQFRLALRAYHLAVLSHLSDQRIILYARHKSNRDYLKEVRQRSHAYPEIPAPFRESVSLFERTWYGRHPASASEVECLKTQFLAIDHGLRSGATTPRPS